MMETREGRGNSTTEYVNYLVFGLKLFVLTRPMQQWRFGADLMMETRESQGNSTTEYVKYLVWTYILCIDENFPLVWIVTTIRITEKL